MNHHQRYLDLIATLTEDQQLLVVSKSRSVDEIKPFIEWGHLDFAENRVSELAEKAAYFQSQGQSLRWHFIGSIQSKQLKKLLSIPGLVAIHSLDSLAHAEVLVSEAKRAKSTQELGCVDLFWQINVAGEAQKQGFLWPAAEPLLRDSIQLVSMTAHQTGLKNRGLMCMGPTPLAAQSELEHQRCTERCFDQLFEMKQTLLEHQSWAAMFAEEQILLSMGMSQDYQLAMKRGSNYLRIGSLLFEP